MAGLNLSRNTRLFISTVKDVGDGSTGADAFHSAADTFEIRVLDGYSFTQETDSQTITLNEAGCTPVRGQKIFNTALMPVDFSFETYIRPYKSTVHRSVEEILWNALVSDELQDFTTTGTVIDNDSDREYINFSDSDTHTLLPLYLFFKFDNVVYRVNDAQINSAEIDFSIDSIAKITWSGQALSIDEIIQGLTIDGSTGNNNDWIAGTDYTAVPAGAAFIKNKLSSMTIEDDSPAVTYNIPITGGSLTIENNIEFLTPEELGVVNFPIGSFTGTRSISGSVTAYLRTSATTTETGDLYSNLISDTTTITHALNIVIKVGTCAATDAGPFVALSMPQAHVVIPTINVEDVISTEIAFTALGTDLDQQDELDVYYVNDGTGGADVEAL